MLYLLQLTLSRCHLLF